MITTLLFDLDNTLLRNDMEQFLPAFLKRLAPYFPASSDPQQLAADVVNATRAMIANTDPARDLFTVFGDCFTLLTGMPREQWLPAFERFYAEAYGELQALTTPLPAARAVLEWALGQGFEVAVTTSPLFMRQAIEARLRWAGVADLPFARVATVENSHFAKPHPEYYAEVLAHLGRRPEQALVIGNDWDNDVAPAAALGIPAYWVTPDGKRSDAPPLGDDRDALPEGLGAVEPLGRGTLDDFLAWAQANLPSPRGHTDQAPAAPVSGPALPYLLAGMAGALHGELAGLPAEAWKARPVASEWSLTEVICHLRDVEREVNLPRMHTLAEVDNPFIAGADTDPWALERNYQAQDGPAALTDFLAARREVVRFLRAQPASIWSRTARHAIFGPTQLAEIVGWVLDHDRIHLAQVVATKRRL